MPAPWGLVAQHAWSVSRVGRIFGGQIAITHIRLIPGLEGYRLALGNFCSTFAPIPRATLRYRLTSVNRPQKRQRARGRPKEPRQPANSQKYLPALGAVAVPLTSAWVFLKAATELSSTTRRQRA